MSTRSASRAAPSLRLRLHAEPEAVRVLRRRLARWLQELGASADEIFDISVAATEAFANALEHPFEPTNRLIDIAARIAEGTFTISMRDSGSWRTSSQRKGRGYGFPLMRGLMDTVEVDARPEGTSITMRRQLSMPALLR